MCLYIRIDFLDNVLASTFTEMQKDIKEDTKKIYFLDRMLAESLSHIIPPL
jgi:hypothetical protein